MGIKELSLDEKIGQRFIFGINDRNIEPVIDLIKKCHIGGIILYKKNYQSYDEMLEVIKRCKEANKENSIPLFIAIDQEGGIVNRMPKDIHNLKNIYDVSRKNDDYVSEYANIIGSMLYQSGINMNLAPVLDIYNGSKSKVLDKRCFYGDSEEVINDGIKYIKELDKNKVIAVVKHFPGHGATIADSHFIIPYIFDYKSVLNKHIKPFENLLKEVLVVMNGHLVIRKLTWLLPVSMTDSFITEYLREKNSYNGIVMTDEINMLKRHLLYRFNYLDKIIESDNDIILVKIKDMKEGFKIIEKYKKILENDCKYLDKLDIHVKRIIDVKDKYRISDDINYDGIDIGAINKRIDSLNNLVNERE